MLIAAASDFFDGSDGWQGGNNKTKQTLERGTDGIGWHTSAAPGGTPHAENSEPMPVLAVQPALVSSSLESHHEDISISVMDRETGSSSSSDSLMGASTTASTTMATGHLLIAAIQITGASSSNDFVKIFNPTDVTVDLSGWKLRKKSSTGADYSLKTFARGSVIAPGGYFVWANSTGGFADSIAAVASSTETLSTDNSVALFDATGAIVDRVAWGTGIDQYVEGEPYPTAPSANQALTRQMNGGAMVDTENNAADFAI